jgi:hypothetical protein
MKFLIVDNGRQHIIECDGFRPIYPVLYEGVELEGKIAETLDVVNGQLVVNPAKLAAHEAAEAAAAPARALYALQEKRRLEYPSIGDQLDALYKARHGDPSELQAIDAKIAGVKTKHPKP